MKPISISSIVIILFFLFSVSCVSTQKEKEKPTTNDSPKTTDPNVNLLPTYWKLIELNGKKITDYPAQNHEPFIRLKENKEVHGTGGCNSMSGHFELKGESEISFSEIIATEMACQGMELESDFYPFLSMVRSYAIRDSTLTLSNSERTISAMFKASASQ